MATGQIKKVVRDRGFGFIRAAGSAEDLFFHRSSVEGDGFDTLEEGQSVEFETGVDDRNPSRSRAINVRTR